MRAELGSGVEIQGNQASIWELRASVSFPGGGVDRAPIHHHDTHLHHGSSTTERSHIHHLRCSHSPLRLDVAIAILHTRTQSRQGYTTLSISALPSLKPEAEPLPKQMLPGQTPPAPSPSEALLPSFPPGLQPQTGFDPGLQPPHPFLLGGLN